MVDEPPSPPLGFTRRQWLALGAALLFLAGAVGYFLGTPRDDDPGRDSLEVGFLYDMIAHHSQALTLSDAEVANGEEGAIQKFAREILVFQSYEIGLMEQRLAEWGHDRDDRPGEAMAWMGEPTTLAEMPGLASEAELDLLSGARGRDADALFVRLMQDHHRGGAHMAEHVAGHTDDRWIRELAETMARNQLIEIREMEAARERAGLSPDPPGYEPG